MTKNRNKVGTIKLRPFSTFQLFKLSKLCYHFLSSFENENIFFISLAIPRPSQSRIHWPISFTKKKWCFCIFPKKKVTSLNRDIHPGDSWPYRDPIGSNKWYNLLYQKTCIVQVQGSYIFLCYVNNSKIKNYLFSLKICSLSPYYLFTKTVVRR